MISTSITGFELEVFLFFLLYIHDSVLPLQSPPQKKNTFILLKYGKLKIHFGFIRGNKKG